MVTTKIYKISFIRGIFSRLKQQAEFIATNHNSDVSREWLIGLKSTIYSLDRFPERCPVAPENSYLSKKYKNKIIRNLFYKKTFRILFIIDDDVVRIINARHSAQDKIRSANQNFSKN